MSIFEIYEIFAIAKWVLNKLSNDIRTITIEALLLKIWEKDGAYFLLFSLFFLQSILLNNLKTSLADIRYLLLSMSQLIKRNIWP